VAGEELLPLLDEAPMALAEADRRAVTLRYLCSRPVEEVARALGVRGNTASKRIERALEKMRRYLVRRGAAATMGAVVAALGLGVRRAPGAVAARILAGPASAVPVPAAIRLGVYMMPVRVKVAAAAAAAVVVGGAMLWTLLSRAEAAPLAIAATGPAASAPAVATTTLVGTVRDAAGKPLAGVVVTQGFSPYLAEGYVKGKTDGAGHFALAGVAVGKELTLAAQAPGYAPELVTGIVKGNEESHDFVLQRSKGLKLRLVDARGKGLANVPVEPVYWRRTETLRVYTWERAGEGLKYTGPTTDGEGRLAWDGAPADAVTFLPNLGKGYLQRGFELSGDGEAHTVVVKDAIRLTLKVVDGAKKPVATFRVVPGWGFDENKPLVWFEQRAVAGEEGAAGLVFSSDETVTGEEMVHFVRIEAPGAAPVIKTFTDEEAGADGA
jgi:hypothetical protein